MIWPVSGQRSLPGCRSELHCPELAGRTQEQRQALLEQHRLHPACARPGKGHG